MTSILPLTLNETYIKITVIEICLGKDIYYPRMNAVDVFRKKMINSEKEIQVVTFHRGESFH